MINDPSGRGWGWLFFWNCSGIIGCGLVIFKPRFYRNPQGSARNLLRDVVGFTRDLYADDCSFQHHQFMGVV
jgi:hypothetical protein